ncbi:MAG: hypothetical protein CMJ58_07770 [Planctomycetaceae bacterium]|nr:hypothetical protein [Planctomycetaceae bacterium]
MNRLPLIALVACSVLAGVGEMIAAEYLSGLSWQEPPIVRPGITCGAPPSDAVVLFGGRDLSAFDGGEKWRVDGGVAIVGEGNITTRQEFGDCQLHIEWTSPTPAEGEGQNRGNSGLFFVRQGIGGGYELQILDSYDNRTYFDGQAGAIYKQTPPLVNAMRPPGEWNAYDVIWHWPRFNEDGDLVRPATITVLQNGVVIQSGFELKGDTPFNRPPQYQSHLPRGPIMLQDHLNPVRFRNIWVREIKPLHVERVEQPALSP